MLTEIKFILRKSSKSTFYTTIKIFGLTVGLAVILILTFFIIQESTYDNYHQNAENTYKIISRYTDNHGKTSSMGISMGILADEYLEQFPEVSHATRLYGPNEVELDLEEKRFNAVRVLYTDFSFLDIFDFSDNTVGSFNSNENAIISREFANKLGGEGAIGTHLKVLDDNYIVSGVVDVPTETTFKFDVLLPIESFADFESWKQGGLEFDTYVVLAGGNRDETLIKLARHYDKIIESKWEGYLGFSYLIPLKEVYLHQVPNKMGNGNKSMLFVVGSVAALILILALINYLNLHVANSHSRQAEIRIRKVMGASTNSIDLLPFPILLGT